jgi:hypothetical protein
MIANLGQHVLALGGEIDGLLRHGNHRRADELRGKKALLVFLVCGGFYGAIMATFAFSAERLPLVAYGMLKVPILFGFTMILAIPGFYVLSNLRGVGSDFKEVFSLLLDYQLLIAITLAALAPITLLVNLSASSDAYQAVQLWNTFTFFIAAVTAQRKFSSQSKALLYKDSRHRLLLHGWTALYAFIGIQMAWTLRPFIGSPGQRIGFLREGKLENAYVKLFEIFSELLGSIF